MKQLFHVLIGKTTAIVAGCTIGTMSLFLLASAYINMNNLAAGSASGYTHSWYIRENPNHYPAYKGMQALATQDAQQMKAMQGCNASIAASATDTTVAPGTSSVPEAGNGTTSTVNANINPFACINTPVADTATALPSSSNAVTTSDPGTSSAACIGAAFGSSVGTTLASSGAGTTTVSPVPSSTSTKTLASSPRASGITILDMGQRENYDSNSVDNRFGADDFDYHIWSDKQIKQAVWVYITTWAKSAPPCARLIVAIGVNNYACMSRKISGNNCNALDFSAAGKAWADLVNALNDDILHPEKMSPELKDQQQLLARVKVYGAADVETTWDAPTPSIDFVKGYLANAASDAPLVNFGDIRADGRWSDQNIMDVTIDPHILVLPESYWGGNNDVGIWTNFKKDNPQVNYIGVLTECQSPEQAVLNDRELTGIITHNARCDGGSDLNPEQAWEQMRPVLSGTFITNIEYQPIS